MGKKIIDKDYVPLTYDQVAKEVFNIYGDLQEIYMELFNRYMQLCEAIDEVDLNEDKNLDKYILGQSKINYLLGTMPDLFEEERELMCDNIDILPFLFENIKKRFNLDDKVDLNAFSAFDPLIFKNCKPLKGNYSAIRMIRAIKYYSIFNDAYTTLVELKQLNYTSEQILASIGLDYSDIESVRTINQIGQTFYMEEDIPLFNKYKCLLMFCNPCIEHAYFLLKLNEIDAPSVSEMEKPDVLAPIIDLMKSKTINTLVTINNSDIINRSRGRLIKELNSNDPIEIAKYSDKKDELYFLYCYLLQSYPYYSLKTIEDFDHLFTTMCKKHCKGYEDIKLSKKVVNYFFRKDAYNNSLFNEHQDDGRSIDDNGYQRKRKDE